MYLNELREVVTRTGDLILQCQKRGETTGEWIGTQFKAQADLIADQNLRKELPGILDVPVVSEEDILSHAINRPTQYWLIDPIDGTASFAQGYSGFVCQVALMVDMRPSVAVVFAPALNRVYSAKIGGGAWLNGRPIKVRDFTQDASALVDNYPEPRGISAYLYRRFGFARYMESGSIGLKICIVAEGAADVFVKDVPVKDWDIAAPLLILQEAGGALQCRNGLPFEFCGPYEKDGIIVCSSRPLLSQIKQLLSENPDGG